MALFLDTLEQYGAAGDVKARSRAYRAHVVAELLYATGMRAAEAASLRVEDTDFERGVVRIREGKGGEPRLAWLDDYASEVLSIYVTTMRDLVLSEQNERAGSFFSA